jgi:hypothetical protein
MHEHIGNNGTQRKVGMLELTMYGLVGLAAMLIVAFYFACRDELPPVRDVHCDRGQGEASRG